MAALLRTALVLAALLAVGSAQLTADFYAQSCPNLETIVSTTLAKLISSSLVAQLVRLQFHDCFVRGCDASILLKNGPPGILPELKAPPNAHITGIGAIDKIKEAVEAACPGVVSCSDILSLAARDAVVTAGGPFVPLLLGRRDGLISDIAGANANLPPVGPLDEIFIRFARQGLGVIDTTVLSAGHSVGVGHCPQVTNVTAAVLAVAPLASCPIRSGGTVLLDTVTPKIFDNQYFKNILNGVGPFVSDLLLGIDPRTAPTIRLLASSDAAFDLAWKLSWEKMSRTNVLTGAAGEIRNTCQVTNVQAAATGGGKPKGAGKVKGKVKGKGKGKGKGDVEGKEEGKGSRKGY